MYRFRFFVPALFLALGTTQTTWAQDEPTMGGTPMGAAPMGGAPATTTDATSETSPASMIVEDFESGVGAWTRSDKSHLGLADIVPTKPSGGAPKSEGAALLAFKSSNVGWASLSRPVDGTVWAKIGADRLVFWINGGGDTQGVFLQLRAKNAGSDLTFSLPRPIRLDQTHWRKVVVPLADFKGPKNEPLAPRLGTVYLLQFLQTGKWDSRFFTLDDMSVEKAVRPTATAPPTVPVAPAKNSPTTPNSEETSGTAKISADFKRISGAIRATGNVSIGAAFSGLGVSPLEVSPQFRGAIALLKPRFVRLDVGALADLSDSSRPSFDFSRLLANAVRVRAIKAEPLVVVTNPPEWGLDARAYGVLCTDAARALNQKGGPAVRYFELTPGGADINPVTALNYYNAAFAALKTLSKNFRVGGMGTAAGDLSGQLAFLKGARGLDFLTVESFGTQSGTPSETLLLSGARDVAALKTAAGALDKSRFPRAPLFVTEANLSSAHNAGESVPSDIRLVQGVSGAWWAQFMASGSRLADQIFHNDAVNPESGLLDDNAHAYPAYYSIWMWNTFFPAGSQRIVATSSNQAIFVAAANTTTAHNLLLVNNSSVPQTAQVGIRGFPILREARIRIFDDPQKSVRFDALPKSPFQTVRLEPYGIAVLQFIEPPRR